jgi:hypothetical protein
MAAGGSAVPPVAGAREDVSVTGRTILATVVDGLVLGLLYTVMAALFGSITRTADQRPGAVDPMQERTEL